ncbi:MAG: dihydroneopterin aldolase [Candidatus Kapabacteria bacterium]|jgi:dihydroneopterin aldolase|nr:dihydroneopterin aldolase [Candidatus Kapabacteria bacterium]
MARSESLTRISVRDAEYFAYHGVRSEERTLGGRYQVDVDLFFNATTAVVSDNINDTINYEEVLFIVGEHMNGEQPYELIETLSYDLATALLDRFNAARRVTVRVRKLNVPVQQILGHVEAEVTASRDDS